MVVVKIMQGLGNQMFQYAAGRALSLKSNQPLKVNIDNYSSTSFRQYELNKFFELKPEIITQEEMKIFNLSHPVRRLWNKLLPFKKIKSLPYEETNKLVQWLYKLCYIVRKPHLQKVYEERQFHFDSNFFNAPKDVFLKGYWHSYKYFDDYISIIKNDFTVKKILVSHLDPTATEMAVTNSIALHIRCTDKLAASHTELHGKPSVDYYKAGIDYIESIVGIANCLYIFTDDIEAAKEFVPQGYKTIWVSSKLTKNAIEDFYLMQQAKNIIISNSTFSWWAAYLNLHEHSIIVVPQKWYTTNFYDAKDVYCPHWVKI